MTRVRVRFEALMLHLIFEMSHVAQDSLTE